jgi:hypothetical protein
MKVRRSHTHESKTLTQASLSQDCKDACLYACIYMHTYLDLSSVRTYMHAYLHFRAVCMAVAWPALHADSSLDDLSWPLSTKI